MRVISRILSEDTCIRRVMLGIKNEWNTKSLQGHIYKFKRGSYPNILE